MNSIVLGWRMGGRVAARLAVVYAFLASLIFYLQISGSGGFAGIWRPDRLWIASALGTGIAAILLTPLLVLIPILMAWLAGSVGGFLTGLMAPFLENTKLARWWGMFCFGIPPLIFHNASDLRPSLVLGTHWLNSYWFWVGLPTLICIFVGGWVGEHLAGSTEELVGHA